MADQHDIGHRAGSGALFSMDAADNAEVIPTDLPRGPESMWSTSANPEEVEEVAAADGASAASATGSAGGSAGGSIAGLPPPPQGWTPPPPYSASPGPVADMGADVAEEAEEVADEQAWAQMGSPVPPSGTRGSGFGLGGAANRAGSPPPPAPTPVGAPGAGGVFSAEPVERPEDVWDEADVVEDHDVDADVTTAPPASPTPEEPAQSVFSSGRTETPVNGAASRARGTAPRQQGTAARAASPFAAPSSDPWEAWERPPSPPPGPQAPPPFRPPPAFEEPTPAGTELRGDPADAVAADQHGLDVAVSRLRPEDQERARVPLSVCGALLAPGEQVLGAVTGQMLGRPAAVVVTRSRVLVVNDRRWQPIVDIYPIDEQLVVRGRHDRHVAALSFADADRLSMVDGITEVEVAIGLADAIRDPDMSSRGTGSAF